MIPAPATFTIDATELTGEHVIYNPGSSAYLPVVGEIEQSSVLPGATAVEVGPGTLYLSGPIEVCDCGDYLKWRLAAI